jgi:hypothetical protein
MPFRPRKTPSPPGELAFFSTMGEDKHYGSLMDASIENLREQLETLKKDKVSLIEPESMRENQSQINTVSDAINQKIKTNQLKQDNRWEFVKQVPKTAAAFATAGIYSGFESIQKQEETKIKDEIFLKYFSEICAKINNIVTKNINNDAFTEEDKYVCEELNETNLKDSIKLFKTNYLNPAESLFKQVQSVQASDVPDQTQMFANPRIGSPEPSPHELKDKPYDPVESQSDLSRLLSRGLSANTVEPDFPEADWESPSNLSENRSQASELEDLDGVDRDEQEDLVERTEQQVESGAKIFQPNIPKNKYTQKKPKKTPKHPKKSHVVVAKVGDKVKTIRFGEQGASTAGKPKSGESDKMKAKRKSFKARHGKNIKKGKMSAAYWADKVKW